MFNCDIYVVYFEKSTKGTKKSVMGKGEWLTLAGISAV